MSGSLATIEHWLLGGGLAEIEPVKPAVTSGLEYRLMILAFGRDSALAAGSPAEDSLDTRSQGGP